jgi:hypothetical protein
MMSPFSVGRYIGHECAHHNDDVSLTDEVCGEDKREHALLEWLRSGSFELF